MIQWKSHIADDTVEVYQRRTRPPSEQTLSGDSGVTPGAHDQQPSMAGRVHDSLCQFGNDNGTAPTWHDGTHQSRGLRLATVTNFKMQNSAGEHDNNNNVHYTK